MTISHKSNAPTTSIFYYKSLISVFLTLLCFPLLAQPLSYQLGSGDLIEISVYDEPDLSLQVKLGDSDSITFPFIGSVLVAGKSTASIETLISERLISGEFLIRPEVTVNILQYRPYYINGEISSPGSYPFEPGLTLRKAITIAGGFTERASKSKISIITKSQIQDSSGQLELLDTPINPDDIITVEQRFF